MTPEEIAAGLDNPPFGDTHYKHPFGLLYTEGVRWLATVCEAYWLLDLIASYRKRVSASPSLCNFCFWTVKHDGKGGCWVICWADTDREGFRQHVPATDFPQVDVKIYQEFGVLMLPAER